MTGPPRTCVCANRRDPKNQGKRRMVGCYLGMDELHSAARVHAM